MAKLSYRRFDTGTSSRRLWALRSTDTAHSIRPRSFDRSAAGEKCSSSLRASPAICRIAAVRARLWSFVSLPDFTVSGDHERQEKVFDRLQQSHDKQPHVIRSMLTEDSCWRRCGEVNQERRTRRQMAANTL